MNIDRSLIGCELPPVAVTVEEQGIRRFAAAIGEADPLYSERNVAAARGFRAVPAPPTYIFCLKTAVAFPGDILKRLGIDHESAMLLHAEQAFTYQGPICGGDRITFRERIADIYEKKGRHARIRGHANRRNEPARRAGRRDHLHRGGEATSLVTTPLSATLEVGTVLPDLVLPPLQRQTLADYAEASNDRSAIHLDPEAARAAGFPDVFAQGMLVMAYLGRAVTDWAPLQRVRAFSARFVAATHLGNELTCRGTVAELFAEEGERRARLDLIVVDQGGEVKLRGSAVVSLE